MTLAHAAPPSALVPAAGAGGTVSWSLARAAPPSALAPGANTGGTTHSLDSGEAVCTGSGHLFRAFPLPGEKLLCCFQYSNFAWMHPHFSSLPDSSQTGIENDRGESKRESRIENGNRESKMGIETRNENLKMGIENLNENLNENRESKSGNRESKNGNRESTNENRESSKENRESNIIICNVNNYT